MESEGWAILYLPETPTPALPRIGGGRKQENQTGSTGTHFPGTRRASVNTRHSGQGKRNFGGSDRAQRKPMLLFLFDGSLLLRLATRRLFPLLFQEPPRRTPSGVPTYSGGNAPVYANYEIVFIQPPNSFPISTSMPDAWRYWRGLVNLRACARRVYKRNLSSTRSA